MTPLLWGMILLVLFARPTHAFGAGNIAGISKVEGQNCKQTFPLVFADANTELFS